MTRRIPMIVLCALVFGLGAACDGERPERTLAFPELIEAVFFPELSEGGRRAQAAQSAEQLTAFERAISRAQQGEDDTEEAPTIQLQTVSLAGRLVADIPQN